MKKNWSLTLYWQRASQNWKVDSLGEAFRIIEQNALPEPPKSITIMRIKK